MLLFGAAICARGRRCDECGAVYEVNPQNKARQRFCSDRCQNRDARRRNYYATQAPPLRKVHCVSCSAPFTTRRSNRRYCDERCLNRQRRAPDRASASSRRTAKIRAFKCAVCAGPLEPGRWKSTVKYCSRKCSWHAAYLRRKEAA